MINIFRDFSEIPLKLVNFEGTNKFDKFSKNPDKFILVDQRHFLILIKNG